MVLLETTQILLSSNSGYFLFASHSLVEGSYESSMT